jgi:hypothetical protein
MEVTMVRRLLVAGTALAVLVVALHLTRNTARGQGVGSLAAITANGGPIFAVDAAGNIYKGSCNEPFARIGQIPAGHTPTCMGGWSNGVAIFIGCSDGTIYTFPNFATPPITPDLCGNVFGGAPTPAVKSTWGELKSRYR